MLLRNLIFGRRPRTSALSTQLVLDASMAEPVLAMAGPGFAEPALAELAAPLVEVVPDAPLPNPEPSIGEPDVPPKKRPARLPVLGLMLGGNLPLVERRSAVVEELSSALSLRHATLIGTERSARFLVANRRVLAASFAGPDTLVDLDLRHGLATEEQALLLHGALSELMAAPVDLLIETRHAAGVYAADGGLPIALLAVDEATLSAAFAPPAEAGKGGDASPADAEDLAEAEVAFARNGTVD